MLCKSASNVIYRLATAAEAYNLLISFQPLVDNVAGTGDERSLDELSEELTQTKHGVDTLRRQVGSLCHEVSQVSADIRTMLRLLLGDQLQTPVSRVTRRDRAARFCRGFSDTSTVSDQCKSLRYESNESSSLGPISANHRHVGILKNSANTSKPLTHRVDFLHNSGTGSQQENAEKDGELKSAAENDDISSNSVKHWLRDVDNLTKSSSPNVAPAAVRLGRSLLRSSTSPGSIQHQLTSLVSVNGQRTQTILTTSTMKRVEKFRRRAAAASSTATVNDKGDSVIASTDL